MTDEILIEDTVEGRPPRSWDFFLTIFFIFMVLLLTGIFVVLGFGFGVATLGCGDSGGQCNQAVVGVGSLLVILGTPLVALAGIIVSVVWIARRKLSFWVPLAAIALAIAIFVLGSFLVDLAVPAS
jgi:hypothetical protein